MHRAGGVKVVRFQGNHMWEFSHTELYRLDKKSKISYWSISVEQLGFSKIALHCKHCNKNVFLE